MAQLPEATEGPANQAFFREVEEELSYDRMMAFFRRWGRMVMWGIAACLAAFAGVLGWQSHLHGVAGEQSEAYAAAIKDVTANNLAGAPPKLAPLITNANEGYRGSAGLLSAALIAKKGDTKGAISAYKALAADTSLDDTWRNTALIRQTLLEYDALAPDVVIDRLKPLAVKGNPWFGTAGELVAIAYVKQNKLDVAGKLFASIAAEPTVPQTISERARQMAFSLGADVPSPTKDK